MKSGGRCKRVEVPGATGRFRLNIDARSNRVDLDAKCGEFLPVFRQDFREEGRDSIVCEVGDESTTAHGEIVGEEELARGCVWVVRMKGACVVV